MTPISITRKAAGRFLITYQGLDRYDKSGREQAVLNYMRKVGSIQFDPLDICGRNAELVLQARIRNFKADDLYRLLYKKRKLTEGWDKVMCIYNMSDYPAFKRRRDKDLAFFNSEACREIRKISGRIKDEIKQSGPVSSLELDIHGKIDWSWAPAKLSRAALETLFFSGQLAIDNRVNTRRVYDLAENIIPPEYIDSPDPHPREEDYHDWRVLRRLKAIGLYYDRSGDGWLGTIKKKERDAAFARLANKGDVLPVEVEGMAWNFYIPSSEEENLEKIIKGDRRLSRNVRFLAPLDNFMWDRFLIEQLFGFTYRWEVYKPQDQREYGYYVLPVLYGDKFIGRIEPVRTKKDNTLEVKNWWWEPGVRKDSRMMSSIEKALEEYVRFLGAEARISEIMDRIAHS
ncbi:winged helix-turn-helix domain-containing protein [Spirochaeta isovalerica]|uniref:Winged helix-turn-helix domain-containing protein n=1 Tax=Spirochaeta isovalerica TaxID=150 RepID=A0A841RBD1_9SPIO|nr:crosslink repair DNA glycosylase YcaQ family protein [Spirochaeta isovalerica]MBB6480219.1 hypothetical protein [Spirochaeta isovalerica]